MNPTKEQWFWEQIFGKDGVEFGETISGKLVYYRRTRWIEADEEWGIGKTLPQLYSGQSIRH